MHLLQRWRPLWIQVTRLARDLTRVLSVYLTARARPLSTASTTSSTTVTPTPVACHALDHLSVGRPNSTAPPQLLREADLLRLDLSPSHSRRIAIFWCEFFGWDLLLGSLHTLSCRANQRPTRGLVDPITKTTSPYLSNYIKSVKLPFFLARINRLPPKSPTSFLLSIYSIVDHTRIDQDR